MLVDAQAPDGLPTSALPTFAGTGARLCLQV